MPSHAWKPRLRRSSAPLYAAIVDALAADISAGKLRAGDRLPTHRELASAIGASLGTITRAYAEAERRGLVRGQVGNGTFVNSLTDRDAYSPMLDRDRIDLGPTAAPIMSGDLGHCALAAALAELSSRADLGALSGYQSHGGTMAQRAAGARWLGSTGVVASPEEITVCSGAQHATAILLSTLATTTGVLVEEITYPGALSAAQWLRLPTHPVAVDEDGLIPDALAQACRSSGAKVLYCTPTNHNPTTSIMPIARRQEVVTICREYGVTIIENGALAPLVSGAPRPLSALAPETTYYIGSLSKATVPALRVGFIRSPIEARRSLEIAAGATVWSGSPLLAEIATQWINDGRAAAIRDARRSEAAARQAIAAEILKNHPYLAHPTAYFLWMRIPEHRRAMELLEQAAAQNVLIGPAHVFAARAGSAPNAIRVSLGAARSRNELERGLAVLAKLLDESPTSSRWSAMP
ncbi:PLP-dependent aminotransferase family protein [Polyangium sp. y55x31]|uniref:aminotransferase-like domain-containing protein n=1 Tax=Polyangium sp. y55x31 TaxID=3042688 RepID=UPI00248230DD|nr:PLP-dependent aminotransferase family protein [Polyangium sp. y55x31]MDI1475429.1 PLP-dependent aminotransferase family protein [Polyangium sp. y55x31]